MTTPNSGEDVEKKELSNHCWWECQMIQALWKTVWHFLKKLNILLPYFPTITLFGIYPKEVKNYVHTKTCTRMFIEALFTIAKT